MSNQNYLATPAEKKSSAEKKLWLTPVLEIIGTDEIEAGVTKGVEGNTTGLGRPSSS